MGRNLLYQQMCISSILRYVDPSVCASQLFWAPLQYVTLLGARVCHHITGQYRKTLNKSCMKYLHMGTEQKTVMTSLIQMLRMTDDNSFVWEHSQRLLHHHWYSCSKYGNIYIWHRAKDIVTLLIQLLEKVTTSTFGNWDQDVVEHAKGRHQTGKNMKKLTMI